MSSQTFDVTATAVAQAKKLIWTIQTNVPTLEVRERSLCVVSYIIGEALSCLPDIVKNSDAYNSVQFAVRFQIEEPRTISEAIALIAKHEKIMAPIMYDTIRVILLLAQKLVSERNPNLHVACIQTTKSILLMCQGKMAAIDDRNGSSTLYGFPVKLFQTETPSEPTVVYPTPTEVSAPTPTEVSAPTPTEVPAPTPTPAPTTEDAAETETRTPTVETPKEDAIVREYLIDNFCVLNREVHGGMRNADVLAAILNFNGVDVIPEDYDKGFAKSWKSIEIEDDDSSRDIVDKIAEMKTLQTAMNRVFKFCTKYCVSIPQVHDAHYYWRNFKG